jgi:cytidylate kinase
MGYVVTIDGPAASGKSSVSRELARRLGWKWISTGAFYRGLAFVASEEGISLEDEAALVELSQSDIWSVEMQPERTEVLYHGHSVTDDIHKDQVGQWASQVSRLPGVRASLLKNQRDCETKTVGLVAEGRDCGSVVFPHAPLKVYLTADQVQRAARRAQDSGMSVAETVASQRVRDHQDSTRKAAPLQVPENAWVLDTTELTLAEAVGLIESRIKENLLGRFR